MITMISICVLCGLIYLATVKMTHNHSTEAKDINTQVSDTQVHDTKNEVGTTSQNAPSTSIPTNTEVVRENNSQNSAHEKRGKQIYEQACSGCHNSGVMNTPILGDVTAWSSITQQRDTATIYQNAINGINAMPARGGTNLPDEDIQHAVDYMLQQAL